ncbi:MAG: S41 family peptidase [Alphaproteobacteria bacterium]|jgi:carboxyl-terminal processing protease|nr:S41 family peptidase [Alphaproteobacteria bacterium]
MKKLLIIVVLLVLIVFVVAEINKKPRITAEHEDVYESVNLFTTILYEVKQSYYKDISFSTLISYAIEGMLEKLDPYSTYMKAEDFEGLHNYTNGELYGVGIQYFKNKNNLIEILHVVDGSPASRGGVKSGDVVLSINNKAVSYLGVMDVSKILAEKDNNIRFDLMHANKKSYSISLNKEHMKLDDISIERYGNILYVRIPSFNVNTSEDLKKIINKNKMSAVILDLRNNGGGLFNQAIAAADLFLDGRMIAKLENSNTGREEIFTSSRGDILKGKSMAILIDGTSASASEVLAGALQENRRAVIVGSKSYGKGVVQDVSSIGNGDYLKLTTGEYLLPNNKSVDGIGIIPDIVAENALNKALEILK